MHACDILEKGIDVFRFDSLDLFVINIKHILSTAIFHHSLNGSI